MSEEIQASRWYEKSSPYIALLAAWIAMSGSLYFSEVAGFIPCTLCWYQRILMYPLAAIIAVGILLRDPKLPYYVLPLSLLGQGFSTYHYLLQKTQIFGAETTCKVGVPCTTIWINWFGFVTIPLLALIAFTIITIAMLIAQYAGVPEEAEDEESPRPWLPVAGIIIVVVAVFLGLAQLKGGADEQATSGNNEGGSTLSIVDQGAAVYKEACAACHGVTGRGVVGVGNDLVHSELVLQETGDAFLKYVRTLEHEEEEKQSSPKAMPPSGGRPDLSDEQILAIFQFLKAQ